MKEGLAWPPLSQHLSVFIFVPGAFVSFPCLCVPKKFQKWNQDEWFNVFYRFEEEEDDEMDPEIEEAFENFCLESEKERAKRQWDTEPTPSLYRYDVWDRLI